MATVIFNPDNLLTKQFVHTNVDINLHIFVTFDSYLLCMLAHEGMLVKLPNSLHL